MSGEALAEVRTNQPVEARSIRLRVNARGYERTVDVWKSLADFIREDLGLTGTHVGCEQGVCGSCTVLFDGEPVRSCLILAVQSDGHALETVESLASDPDHLHPLQEAFRRHHGLQCGYCTPGILMATLAFLRDVPRPTETQIRQMLAGYLCRCTGYQLIVESIQAAADALSVCDTGPPGASGPGRVNA